MLSVAAFLFHLVVENVCALFSNKTVLKTLFRKSVFFPPILALGKYRTELQQPRHGWFRILSLY